MIYIVDFGSQTTHLIARRLKELGSKTKIVDPENILQEVKKEKPQGIILSGGPASVYEKNAPTIDKKIFSLDMPILGICYGMQLTAQLINNKESEFFQHMEVEENNFALSGVKKVESVLLIESEFDQIIPHRIIELYKKEISDVTHKIIKGADHQLSKEEWKKEFIDILIEWFSTQ